MLQFRYNEDKYAFEIAENSQDKWRPLHRKNEGYSQEFINSTGEYQITILSSGMQSGITHVVVVISSVDSYHKVYEANVNRRTGPQAETDAVNQFLRQYEVECGASF